MKFLFSFICIIIFGHLSKATVNIHVFNPDSIKDTVLCAPASFNEPEKKGETGTWKMYAVAVKDSLQNKSAKANELTDKLKRRKKIFATLLAFPVPFGIIGLHRIYLGTKPYVPLVYIATLGGAAGIVPFIDFIVLLLEKDISRYENNSSIIMWAN